MGLHIVKMPPIVRPQERVEYATIPGRAGSLTFKEGEHVYDAYEMEVTVYHLREQPLTEVFRWLRGSGRLILCNEPDRMYDADIAAEVRFSPVDNDWEQATIAFYVQPYKHQYPPELPITLESTQTVDYKTLAEYIMQNHFQLGNTNILTRPKISERILAQKGWNIYDPDDPDPDNPTPIDPDDPDYEWGYATVFSVTYDVRTDAPQPDDDWMQGYHNMIVHMTPIKYDPDWETMTEEQLAELVLSTTQMDAYMDRILASSVHTRDEMNALDTDELILWAQDVSSTATETDWEDAYARSELYDELLHELQAVYFELDDDEGGDWRGFPSMLLLRKFDAGIALPPALPCIDSHEVTINNPSDLPGLPIWHLPEIDGNLATIIVNDVSYIFERADKEFSATIDCEAELVTDETGVNMDLLDITHGFPILQPGENTITVDGFSTSILLEPRWRWT